MQLDHGVLEQTLRRAVRDGADFADIFMEDRLYEGVATADGKVNSMQTGVQRGAGIRVVKGETTALVYTEMLTEAGLLEAAATASSIARGGSAIRPTTLALSTAAAGPAETNRYRAVDKQEKVELALRADRAASDYSQAVKRVSVYYVDSQQDVVVANSEGLFATDRRCRVRCQVQVTAERNGRKATGTAAPGAATWSDFLRENSVEAISAEAVEQALTIVDAAPMPGGQIPVILAPGIGGVLFHEVAGHCLEGDSVAKQGSPYQGKLGQRVANTIVSAADDATVPDGWSSYGIDDEGTPGQRTMLIQEGILCSYITDRSSARQLGTRSSGNARRSSYRSLPVPRMSNTYILPGQHSPEEIIAGTDYGLYAVALNGGSVDSTTGQFNFAVNLGYLIQNGRLVAPVRDAIIMGQGLEVLMAIDAVGNDLKLVAASCQKEGGRVSVGIGQPTVRVRSLHVASRG